MVGPTEFDSARLGGRRPSARLSRGEDAREVTPRSVPKNLSNETTFSADVTTRDELSRRLWPLCEKVSARIKARGLSGRTVTLKLKTAKFKNLTRSQALPAPTQLAETIFRAAMPLLDKAITGAPPRSAYRLIGVGLSNFEDAAAADPPDLADPDAAHRKRVENTMDRVREKLGRDAITKGRGLGPKA